MRWFLIGSNTKILVPVILIAITLLTLVQGAEYGKISLCDSQPLCVITQNSSNQPTLIEPAPQETKETYDRIQENTSAEWTINATGPRRYINVTVLAQVNNNPFVQDKRGQEHRKEIQIKGLIPETDTVGHPFYMANYSQGNTYKNPQVLPANNNEFHGKEEFNFDSKVNVSNAPYNSEWTAFMFANSTNPFVDQDRSKDATVQIQGRITNTAPNPANLTSPENNTVFTETNEITFNVSVSDPDGDNMTVQLEHYNPDFTESRTKVENGTFANFTKTISQGPHEWEVIVGDGSKQTTTPENSKWQYTIDSTAPSINGDFNPSITYPEDWSGFDYSANDVGTDTYIWSINNTNQFTVNSFGELDEDQQLGAGSYPVNLSVEDDEGDVGSETVTLNVQKDTPTLSLNASGFTYPEKASINASENNGGDNDLTYNLAVNGQNIQSGSDIETNIELSAGTHTIGYSTTGGENYTSASTTETINIEKGSTETNLFFSNNRVSKQNDNLSLNEGATLNITASTNISKQSQVSSSNLNLTLDNLEIGIIDGNNRTAENYAPSQQRTVTGNFTGNENYTKSNQTQTLFINQKPRLENLSVKRVHENKTFFEFDVFDDKGNVSELIGLDQDYSEFTNSTLKFNSTNTSYTDTLKLEDLSTLQGNPFKINISINTTGLIQSSYNTSNFSKQFVEINETLYNDGDNLSYNATFGDYGNLTQSKIQDEQLVPTGENLTDREVWKQSVISFNASDLKTDAEKTSIDSRFIGFKELNISNNGQTNFTGINTSQILPNQCFSIKGNIPINSSQERSLDYEYSCKIGDYRSDLRYETVQEPFKHTFERDIKIYRNLTEALWKIDDGEAPQSEFRVNESVKFDGENVSNSSKLQSGALTINLGKQNETTSTGYYNYSVQFEAEKIEKVFNKQVERDGSLAQIRQPLPMFSTVQGTDTSSVKVKNIHDDSNTIFYRLEDNCEGLKVESRPGSGNYLEKGTTILDYNEQVTIDLKRKEGFTPSLSDSCNIFFDPNIGDTETFKYESSPLLYHFILPTLGAALKLLLAVIVLYAGYIVVTEVNLDLSDLSSNEEERESFIKGRRSDEESKASKPDKKDDEVDDFKFYDDGDNLYVDMNDT